MAKQQKQTKPKKGRGKKIIITILAFALVACLGTSIAFNVLMYRKINPPISGDNTVEKPPLDDDNIIVTPIDPPGEPDNPSPILPPDNPEPQLFMMPRTAMMSEDNSAINVQITVTPDVELPDTLIDWSIAFADADSDWAKDKDIADYAAITTQVDGALTANFSVIQAFGEQIIITAALRTNSDVNAICTADYARKFYISDIAVSSLSADSINEYKSVITPVSSLSDGTIDDPITCTGYLKPTQKFVEIISAIAGTTSGFISNDYVAYLTTAQIDAQAESNAITANRFAFIQSDSSQREKFAASFSGYGDEHMY